MKIFLAIPAFNCEDQIQKTISEITVNTGLLLEEIWVVDNRSTDNTLKNAIRAARNYPLPNIRIFQNDENISLGGTQKSVFFKAAKAGATHVIILHGDNQAKSEEVMSLIQCSESSNYISVLGSRFMRDSVLDGYDKKRIFGNYILNGIYSLFTCRKLNDLGSGLNLFRLSDLDFGIYSRFPNSLGFNYALILDLAKRKVPFKYLPITWREDGQVSNTRNLTIFIEALKILKDYSGKQQKQQSTNTNWKEIHQL